MFGGQKRHDPVVRHVATEIRDQVAEVVFLLRADGAVGQEHECALTREAADGMIGVYPRVHAFARRQLGPRRPQFGRDDGRTRSKR